MLNILLARFIRATAPWGIPTARRLPMPTASAAGRSLTPPSAPMAVAECADACPTSAIDIDGKPQA